MNDLTYIIPVKIESEDRLKNIITSVTYLLKNFPESKILIKEVSEKNIFSTHAIPKIKTYTDIKNLTYIFEKSSDLLFYKTKILNDLILLSDTKVICSHDVDVIYPINSHKKSYEMIVNDNVDVVYPYGCGIYQYQVNYPMEIFELFLNSNFDMNIIQPRCNIQTSTIGWSQFYNRESVIKGGLWNENFLSWGAEDCEFYFRFNILGFKVERIDDWIWHFEHSRTHNSHYHNPKFHDNNNLWQWMRKQNKSVVLDYINKQDYLHRRNINVSV